MLSQIVWLSSLGSRLIMSNSLRSTTDIDTLRASASSTTSESTNSSQSPPAVFVPWYRALFFPVHPGPGGSLTCSTFRFGSAAAISSITAPVLSVLRSSMAMTSKLG